MWDPVARRYTDLSEKDPAEIVKAPHVFGLTREVDMRRPGSWIGVLFEYRPPQFGFGRGEQRLLLAALHGGTDRELSDALGISLTTVKKTWRSIYARVAARSPDLIAANSAADGDEAMPERGREKKHPLIAYLRDTRRASSFLAQAVEGRKPYTCTARGDLSIRYRPMRPNDVEECVSIVAAHPIAGPRYAVGIADLGPAWHRLLAGDGFCAATVFEDTTDASVTTIGVGVSVFVSDLFAREVKESPYFWIGPELAKESCGVSRPCSRRERSSQRIRAEG